MRPVLALLALLVPAVLAGCAASRPSGAALEAEVRALVARHPGALVAVSVRDPSTGVAFDVNGDSVMHAASTMKLPVLVELYRQAEAGTLRLSDPVTVTNRFRSIVDGSAYAIEDDSDTVLYRQIGQATTLEALAERMTTVSSNLAANLLIERLGAPRVQATLERLGGTHGMQVRRGVEDGKAFRAGLNNVATSHDLAELLVRLAEGRAVSPAADRAMRAVLLRQTFNEMIPQGLASGTPVAHKTGWVTGIRHDAAIVRPESGRPYVLVVLTRGVERPEDADALGAAVARLVDAWLRGQNG